MKVIKKLDKDDIDILKLKSSLAQMVKTFIKSQIDTTEVDKTVIEKDSTVSPNEEIPNVRIDLYDKSQMIRDSSTVWNADTTEIYQKNSLAELEDGSYIKNMNKPLENQLLKSRMDQTLISRITDMQLRNLQHMSIL